MALFSWRHFLGGGLGRTIQLGTEKDKPVRSEDTNQHSRKMKSLDFIHQGRAAGKTKLHRKGADISIRVLLNLAEAGCLFLVGVKPCMAWQEDFSDRHFP